MITRVLDYMRRGAIHRDFVAVMRKCGYDARVRLNGVASHRYVARIALDQDRSPPGRCSGRACAAPAGEWIEQQAARRDEEAHKLREQAHWLCCRMPVPVAHHRHEEKPVVLA